MRGITVKSGKPRLSLQRKAKGGVFAFKGKLIGISIIKHGAGCFSWYSILYFQEKADSIMVIDLSAYIEGDKND